MDVYLVILIVLVVGILYILYQVTSSASLIKALVSLNKETAITVDNLTSPTSKKFSYEAWVLITDAPVYDDVSVAPRNIFGRDSKTSNDIGMGICIDKESNSPVLFLSSFAGDANANFSQKNTIVTTEFPLNRWVFITLNVSGAIVEVYLNGKLVKTVQYGSEFSPSKTTGITIGRPKLIGYITRFTRNPTTIDQQTVWKDYLKGNGQYGGALFGILDYINNYTFKIDISKNHKVIREMSLGTNMYDN